MKRTLLLLLLATSIKVMAQPPITVSNPGFEGIAKISAVPEGWQNCGFENESPPDLHPTLGFKNPSYSPAEGNTFLTMVTRDNGTYECVFTEVSTPLLRNQSYRFNLSLLRFPEYHSISRTTNEPVNYNTPLVLRVWGAENENGANELLAVSPFINHNEWQEYEFTITPSKWNVNLLILEAYYPREGLLVNGNICLDAMSIIQSVELDVNLLAFSERVHSTTTQEDSPQLIRLSWITQKTSRADLKTYFNRDILPNIWFTEVNTFGNQQYQIEETGAIFNGNPFLFTLAKTTESNLNGEWELIVYNDDPSVEAAQIATINTQLSTLPEVTLTARAYNEELDKRNRWFAGSDITGLYLKQRK